jgi:hypothetical protein
LCVRKSVTEAADKHVREMIFSKGLVDFDVSIQYHDTGSENARL